MTDDVRIQVNAMVDGAVTNLNKVNTALGKTGTAAEKSGGGFKSMVGKVDGAVRSITGFSLAQVGVTAVLAKGVQVLKQSVSEWISYTNAMTDGARLTGVAVEEYSKLVQVADDVRLTQEQLKTSFQIAAKQGIDVSIDGIKRLSEQYNGMTDPVEKAQFLLTAFGRSGADMGRLLEMGADGIDEATAAIANNLVVTKESAAEAEELRLAQDALNDAWTGAKNVIAQAVIPGLTKLATGLFKVLTYTQDLKKEFEDTADNLKNDSETWEEYALGIIKAGQETGQLHEMSARMAAALLDGKLSGEAYDKALKQLVIELGGLSKASFSAKGDIDGLNQMVDEGIVYFGDLGDAIQKLALEDMEAVIQAAADLSDSLSGQMELTLKLTDLTGNYTDKMEELKNKHGELEEKLAGLKLKFPWDKAGIAEAEQALIDNQAEIDKTADAYDLATKRIVWDMMVAKLAIDGYTQAEFNWAMQAGVDMGIITQESADLAVALMADSDKQIQAFEDAQAAAEAYQQMISGMTGTEISIVTHYVYDYTGAGEAGQIGDPGGGTLVPRGGGGAMRPGQSFNVNEMDGAPAERVRSGYGGYVSTTTNYNMTINAGNVSTNDVIFGFRTLESLGD